MRLFYINACINTTDDKIYSLPGRGPKLQQTCGCQECQPGIPTNWRKFRDDELHKKKQCSKNYTNKYIKNYTIYGNEKITPSSVKSYFDVQLYTFTYLESIFSEIIFSLGDRKRLFKLFMLRGAKLIVWSLQTIWSH